MPPQSVQLRAKSEALRPRRALPFMHNKYLRLLSSCQDIVSLLKIHAHIIVSGLGQRTTLNTHILNSYSSLQRCDLALLTFNSVPNPGVVLYNTMIRAFTRSNQHDKALGVYRLMLNKGLEPDRYTFTFVLKACAGALDLKEGVRVHEKVVERKLDGDLFICTGLVDLYCKVGDLGRAMDVFEQMPVRDVVSCNAMIAGLSQSSNPEESVELFRSMQFSDIRPNSVSLLNLFPAVSRLGDVGMCSCLHGYVMRRDFKGGVSNGLIDLYAKCGDIEAARLIFNTLDNGDDVSWSSMMAGYAYNCYFHEVLELYDGMIGMNNAEMNRVSIVSALLAAGELRRLEKGEKIHKLATERGIDMDVDVATPIITMYAKCGELKRAEELFKRIPERDIVAWSALIAAFVQSGYPEKAFSLFTDMQHQTVKPNRITLVSVLPACAELISPALGKSIHCYAIKHDIDSDISVGTALVSMYVKCGCFNQALIIFENMPCKDVVTWNAVINGYSQMKAPFSAIDMFKRLQIYGLYADAGTMVGILTACAYVNDLSLGTPIHALVINRGFESDCHVMNALIDMYSKCGNLSSALYLFNSLFLKDDVSWNIMISAYMHNGDAKGALSVYYQMRSVNLLPSAVTFVSVVPAATYLAAIREGMAFHSSIIQMGLLSNSLVGNSLIDMYSKCGRIDLSRRCFDEMENNDTVSWNSLLAGYAVHGQGDHAVALFSLMQERHVEVDSVSYLSVLSACRHAGLIEQGRQIFHSMEKNHQIQPNVEHYACMVDLLGRAGLFDETICLIEKMPMAPDAGLWGALLGACRMHSNVKLAEVALHNLIKLEPGNPTHFVVLSSIYARSGQWADAGITRSKLKDTGLKKTPGWSWV